MKQVGMFLMGDHEVYSFENRMFNAMIFLAFVMTFLGGIMDLIFMDIITWWFAFSILWLLFYYMSRFMGQFLLSAQISFSVLIFIFFPYSWVNSNGTIGVFPYYAIISIAYVNMILRGRTRLFMNISMIIVVSGLFIYDYFYSSYLEMTIIHNNLIQFGIHIFIAMLAMAVLIMIYANTYMKEKRHVEAYAQVIEEHYNQQLYYMESLETLNQKLNSERHDFNHHLGVVYGLLEDNEGQKARDYTHKLVTVVEDYQSFIYTPYPVIRAMINYKLSMVSEEGIDFNLRVNLSEGLDLNEYDLTIILGNMLDNAVESCMLLEVEHRYIELNVYVKLDYLVIQVKNARIDTQQDEAYNYETTKEDSENHGFGLKNIEYLVNKYNGMMKVEQGNDFFVTDVALLIET